jgi:cell division protein FtsI/penicillin-binding protein 2
MGNLPIGQGELVTPIQMATAYSTIANGGILRPPRVVRSVGGHVLAEPPGRRVLSPATAAAVRQMLQGVLGPEGTASQVSVPGYELAGKTGFAPASNPKLLCAVVVDEPQAGSIYGGAVAAPAFAQIMSFALPYMGIPPG